MFPPFSKQRIPRSYNFLVVSFSYSFIGGPGISNFCILQANPYRRVFEPDILNKAPLVDIINRGKISRFHALLAAGALLSFINYNGGLISQDRELN